MPATVPPLSLAVPEIVTLVPSAIAAPCDGLVIVELGAVVSVDCGGRRQSAHQRRRLGAHVGEEVDGRLLHDGIGRGAAGGPLLNHAFVVSRPHAHCTVPAPNTSAPLGAWYIVRWCVCGRALATRSRSR